MAYLVSKWRENCVLSAHSSFGAFGLTPGPLGGSFQQALTQFQASLKTTRSQTPYLWTLIVPLQSAHQPGVYWTLFPTCLSGRSRLTRQFVVDYFVPMRQSGIYKLDILTLRFIMEVFTAVIMPSDGNCRIPECNKAGFDDSTHKLRKFWIDYLQ